jgi:hypothetical protein
MFVGLHFAQSTGILEMLSSLFNLPRYRRYAAEHIMRIYFQTAISYRPAHLQQLVGGFLCRSNIAPKKRECRSGARCIRDHRRIPAEKRDSGSGCDLIGRTAEVTCLTGSDACETRSRKASVVVADSLEKLGRAGV